MTLSFMTHWSDGTPTNFINKIWKSLLTTGVVAPDSIKEGAMLYIKHSEGFKAKFGGSWIEKEPWSMSNPKHHTIRFLTKKRAELWMKEGRQLHFSVGTRMGPKYQFAPVVPVVNVQQIVINPRRLSVSLPNKYSIFNNVVDVECFAKNDGFDSVDKFFEYFTEEKIDQARYYYKQPYLISWTNQSYELEKRPYEKI